MKLEMLCRDSLRVCLQSLVVLFHTLRNRRCWLSLESYHRHSLDGIASCQLSPDLGLLPFLSSITIVSQRSVRRSGSCSSHEMLKPGRNTGWEQSREKHNFEGRVRGLAASQPCGCWKSNAALKTLTKWRCRFEILTSCHGVPQGFLLNFDSLLSMP